MSEQNILNPTAGSELSPDYGYSEGLPQMLAQFQAKSGSVVARQLLARGRVYDLVWGSRLKSTADALRQWEAQYRNDFFTYQDIDRGRYFSGRFAAPPTISESGNNKWDIRAQFVEIPGLPMFQSPGEISLATSGTLWETDAKFLEERDGFGNTLVKLTGTWNLRTDALGQHGSGCYISSTIGDTAEILYYGYGYRLWAPTRADSGKVTVSVDGVVLATYDQYSAANLPSAPFNVDSSRALGFHRVKLTVAAKNPLSSGNNSYFDAIEVMQ